MQLNQSFQAYLGMQSNASPTTELRPLNTKILNFSVSPDKKALVEVKFIRNRTGSAIAEACAKQAIETALNTEALAVVDKTLRVMKSSLHEAVARVQLKPKEVEKKVYEHHFDAGFVATASNLYVDLAEHRQYAVKQRKDGMVTLCRPSEFDDVDALERYLMSKTDGVMAMASSLQNKPLRPDNWGSVGSFFLHTNENDELDVSVCTATIQDGTDRVLGLSMASALHTVTAVPYQAVILDIPVANFAANGSLQVPTMAQAGIHKMDTHDEVMAYYDRVKLLNSAFWNTLVDQAKNANCDIPMFE